ncbi:hypothetical protein [Azospirillum halopraeferens]|uniref:hypothetical protein n=1 Tax=Azospirillum halopraeferens TaxID=34010 RepID=UPI000427403B|nr:hypothetical protein [Azospirillum halopraeferens]
MLFLRDIDGDVRLRCLSCGHEGVQTRAALLRRFGPGYPVLSLAPHFRCSRCRSRDVESRPIVAPPPVPPVPDGDDADAGALAAIAALRSFAAAVRGDVGPETDRAAMDRGETAGAEMIRADEEAEPRGRASTGGWTADALLNDLLDSIAEEDAEPEPERDADPEPEPEPVPAPEPEPADESGDEADPLENALAALRALGADTGPGDVDEAPPAMPEEPDTPEAFFRGLGRFDAGAPVEDEDEVDGDDDPLDETIAALRALAGPADAGSDAEEVRDEDDEEEEFSDEEILSFAIRDPEAEPAAETGDDGDDDVLDLVDVVPEPEPEPDETPEPGPAPPADVFEETLAALRGLVGVDAPPARPAPPEPEPEPEPEAAPEPEPESESEPEPGDEPEDAAPAPVVPVAAPSRPQPMSMEASLAALREMVEKAAAEEEPPARPKRPHKAKPAPHPPERPFSETLAALRGMLDLDKDGNDRDGNDRGGGPRR